MAIDFFKPVCQTNTSVTSFGIIDIDPAELSFTDTHLWNVTINNPNEVEVTHTAVDKCLDIPSESGKRCDSMLTYENTLLLIEIKERESSGWIGEGLKQLTNTISIFKNTHSLSNYTRLYGQIANIKRPFFRQNISNLNQSFQDETGFILRVSTSIDIE